MEGLLGLWELEEARTWNRPGLGGEGDKEIGGNIGKK